MTLYNIMKLSTFTCCKLYSSTLEGLMLSGDELLPNENMMFEKFLSKFFGKEEVWKNGV